MNLRPVCCVLALLLVGCTDGKPASDPSCSVASGRTIGAGVAFGREGDCNLCTCSPPEAPFCYRASCPDASVGLRCQTSDDCGGDTCLFDQGCDGTPGYCVSRAQGCAPGAPPELRSDTPAGTTIFCGCDGRTYASSCPSVRYAHTGACSP